MKYKKNDEPLLRDFDLNRRPFAYRLNWIWYFARFYNLNHLLNVKRDGKECIDA